MIDAERVRSAADDVLGRQAYAELRESPLSRLLAEVRSWFAERLFDLFSGTTAASIGLIIAIVVVLLVVGLGIVALLGAQRRVAADLVVDDVDHVDVADAVAAAAAARANGDLVTAVRRRYGALLLALEERDVVPRVPGLTVGEVDAAVARSVPALGGVVADAGDVLADIVYGHRAATAADDDLVAAALRDVRRVVPHGAVMS